MKFLELRAALAAAGKDPLAVVCSDYDDIGVINARGTSDGWVLRHRDSEWEVGGVERGRFLLDSSFASEDEAVDRLAGILLVDRPVHVQSAEERARSDAVTREAGARAREQIERMRRRRPR